MLVSISGAVRLKREGKRWRMNLMSAGRGVATLSTKTLLPERHPLSSGPLAQVKPIPGRLCWKVTVSVLENKLMFFVLLTNYNSYLPAPCIIGVDFDAIDQILTIHCVLVKYWPYRNCALVKYYSKKMGIQFSSVSSIYRLSRSLLIQLTISLPNKTPSVIRVTW
jgi:hypothetical protein